MRKWWKEVKVTAFNPPGYTTSSPISLHLVPLPQKSIISHLRRRMHHKYLLPTLRQVDVTLGDPVFQRGNARIHTSHIMRQFFTPNNIDVAYHPPYSPDLTNAWVLLKRQVTEDYPSLANTLGGVDTVKARLAEVLPLCWEKIPETQ